MSVVIEVSGLRYRYPGGGVALDGVDFRLEAGETVALLGPNGSGKTTFLLALVGLVDAEGEIVVCGERLRRRTRKFVRSKAGLLFQDSDDQLFMPTVAEDVAFGPLNQGLEPVRAEARAQAALRAVGMESAGGRSPHQLSAGEKRRVALAGLLASDPEVLLLDEPSIFLDPPGRRELAAILEDLPQAKLLVTHDVGLAQTLARRAVFFQEGRVAGEGTVSEVAARFGWDDRR